jgi:hypothetical protein
MWNRCFGVLLVAILVLVEAACGSSPAAPTFPILQGPGPYHLCLTGFANSTVPEVPSCVPPVTAFTEAHVYLDVSRGDVSFWIGRTLWSLGDFEFRIQGDEEVTGGFQLSGSVQGTAFDTAYPGGLKGLHPEFAITVKISGATHHIHPGETNFFHRHDGSPHAESSSLQNLQSRDAGLAPYCI